MWKFKRILLIALFVIGAIISPAIVQAEEVLPEGGDGFNNAVPLDLNINTDYHYDDDRIESDDKVYYKLEGVKPGQRLVITTILNTDVSGQGMYVKLYNMDRRDLDEGGDSQKITLDWLPNSKQDTYSYYLRLETTGRYEGEEVNFNLNVKTEDYFDADSETDAGDEVTDPMDLKLGSLTGYLSGEREDDEADTIDNYKVELEEEKKLSLRLTPPSDTWGSLDIFNSDREHLKGESGSNTGAIVDLDFTPEETGEYIIAVRGNSDENNLVEYTLESEIEGVTAEETTDEEETTEAPSDAPTEEEIRDIQNQIENQIKGNGEQEGWIDTVRGIVFSIIKYVAIALGAIILVIVFIIFLIKKGKTEKKEETKQPKKQPEDQPEEKKETKQSTEEEKRE